MTDKDTSWYKKGLVEYAIYNINENAFLMVNGKGGYCWAPGQEDHIVFRADQVDSYIDYMQGGTIDKNIHNEETDSKLGMEIIEFVVQNVGWENVMFIPATMTGELSEDGIKRSTLDYVHGFRV